MKTTDAVKFMLDSNVRNATKQLVEALKKHQSKISGVRPADPDLKQSFEQTIAHFEDLRGGKLFLPYLSSGLGNGALVELADGSVKYDFITGIGVHFFGHSHPEIVAKEIEAALCDTVMQGNLMQDFKSVGLTSTILRAVAKNNSRLKHCFLTATGVMAGENALKMAFQKKTPADRVLCFKNCFMGRTLIMSQTTDNPAYREGLPKFIGVDYIPYYDETDPAGSTQAAVDALKKHLADHPGKHAAMCFELVLGEGGFYPGSHDFFVALMDILKANGIPILVDEVQSFARTPELFAYQYFGLDAYVDAVWIGKASQACATLFTDEIKPRPGLLSQTYTASTSAIVAGQYIVKTLLEGGYYGPEGKIVKLHNHFVGKLKDMATRHPDLVRGPYGIGAMVAFTPYDGSLDKVKKLIFALYEAGVIAFYCGHGPVRMRFLFPAGCATENDIDAVCAIIERCLVEVSQGF